MCFEMLFKLTNQKSKKLKAAELSEDPEADMGDVPVQVLDPNLTGLNHLWNLIVEVRNPRVLWLASRFIISLHVSLGPKVDYRTSIDLFVSRVMDLFTSLLESDGNGSKSPKGKANEDEEAIKALPPEKIEQVKKTDVSP